MSRWLIFIRLPVVVGVWLVWVTPVSAQWVSQSIPLKPGWNAVHFTVDPEPRTCDSIFTNSAIESVWMWNRQFSAVEFDIDPADLIPEDPHWLLWLPPSDPRAFLSTFFGVNAHGAYLVRVETNSAPFAITVKGRPSPPDTEWYPHALNLIGFPIHPAAPPTFEGFFEPTEYVSAESGHDPEIFTINTSGRAVPVVQPYRDRMAEGAAYWIQCRGGACDYYAPFSVDADGAGELDFGDKLRERTLTVHNESATESLPITLRHLPSEAAPDGQPEVAGDVLLSYYAPDPAAHTSEWVNLPASMDKTLAPGETWHLRLGVRRAEFAPYIPSGPHGYAWQSVLQIEDQAQSARIRVPVTVREAPLLFAMNPSEHPIYEGLWVGTVRLTQVNRPHVGTNGFWDTTTMEPVDLAFNMRLILHVDSNGTSRLLQRCILAWDDDLGTNGAYALYADESLAPVDAEDVTRIGSTAFHPMDPVVMSGSMTGALTCTVTLGYNDPVNPFKHTYHPMHDNKDADFSDTPLPDGEESWTVQREITLDFSAHTDEHLVDPVWGYDEHEGEYYETMDGLRKHPVRTAGTFRLRRIGRQGGLRQ